MYMLRSRKGCTGRISQETINGNYFVTYLALYSTCFEGNMCGASEYEIFYVWIAVFIFYTMSTLYDNKSCVS